MIDIDNPDDLEIMYNKLIHSKVTFSKFLEFIRNVKDESYQRGYDQAQETYSIRSNY